MKILCSQLLSLLPDDTSKERLTLEYKIICEDAEYIESMKLKLENKEGTPLLEVQEMGQNLDVVIANEVDGYSMFHGLVKLLRRHGNSTIQILHDKVGDSKLSATTMLRKMKELVCETSNSATMEPR